MDIDWVVERMAKGSVLKRQADGDFRIGRRRLRPADVATLLAEDLLTSCPDGRFDLSVLGRARARRVSLGCLPAGAPSEAALMRPFAHQQK